MRTEPTWDVLRETNPVPDADHLLGEPVDLEARFAAIVAKTEPGIPPSAATGPAPASPRRRAAVAMAAAFAGVLAIVGAVVLLRPGTTTPETPPATEVTPPTTVATPNPTVAPPTTAPPATTTPPAPVVAPSAPGPVTFSGQQYWSSPLLFTGPDGLPAVLVGTPGGATASLDDAAIARCVDTDCTALTTTGLPGLAAHQPQGRIGDGTGYVSWWPAIRDDGSPVVAVGELVGGPDAPELIVTLLTCTSPSCESADTAEALRVPGRDDAHLRLALGPGNEPVVSVAAEDVSVAVCADAACTGGADVTVLEGGAPGKVLDVYGRLSLVVDPEGRPVVLYGRQTDPEGLTGETVLVSCFDPGCRTFAGAVVETWLSTFTAGPVLTLGPDGLPVLAHWRWWDDPQTTSLIACRDVGCTDRDATTLPSWGDWVTISTGTEGYPVLALLADDQMTLVSCRDRACAGFDVTTPLGDLPNQWTPMVTVGGEGTPWLAYVDSSPLRELHIERCTDAVCTSVVDADVTGAGTVVVPDWAGVIDFDGDTHAFAEARGLVLRVVGEQPADPAEGVPIVRQDPAPGTKVPIWSELTIWLENGE